MGTLPSRMEVTVIINILLLFFLALVAQVEAQISFGSSQSSQQTAAVSRPSQSNSRPIFSQRPTSNQSGNFIVKNRNQQLESNTRHGCCFFANNICNAPCAGRLCSAQCTVQCGIFGGTCAPITCAAAAPTTCLASTATTTTTTAAPTITTATTTTVAPIVTACPVGYSQVSSSKCWQLSSTSLDWLDALTNCVQQGGTLATVDNQQEQDALSGLIPTSISSLPLTGGVWIGLSDILREGTFDTWRDDSPVIFSGWKVNQPNNGASGAQHCVQARPEWDDVICRKLQPFICQLPAQVTAPRQPGRSPRRQQFFRG